MVWAKFNPDDDDQIWTEDEDGALSTWSIKDMKPKKLKGIRSSFEDKYESNGFKVSFEGYNLTVKKGGSDVISDTQKGIITDAVFSTDGKFVISTNENGEIAMYDLKYEAKSH